MKSLDAAENELTLELVFLSFIGKLVPAISIRILCPFAKQFAVGDSFKFILNISPLCVLFILRIPSLILMDSPDGKTSINFAVISVVTVLQAK